MNIFLAIVNLLLLGIAVYIFFFRKKKDEKGPLSDMEGMDLLEFQQNLKALIEELNVVANTNIISMEEKKKQVEETIKLADARINEIKYLLERNKLKKQGEHKEAISDMSKPEDQRAVETPAEVKPDIKKDEIKEKPAPSRLIATGLEDNEENAAENKPAGREKYQHINSLLKNGLSVDEIAKVTGLTRGEIELIRNIKL
jgi:hypothetical protein